MRKPLEEIMLDDGTPATQYMETVPEWCKQRAIDAIYECLRLKKPLEDWSIQRTCRDLQKD